MNIGIHNANVWHGHVVMSGSHRIKGGTTDEVFQALTFRFNLQDLLHAQESIYHDKEN